MSELTDKEIAAYKARLDSMKAELEALVAAAAPQSDPVTLDQSSVGRLSRMDALQGQAMAQATERRRATEIRRIEAALQRIEDGEYGYCVVSGDPIPRARLDLDPAAATTVDHAP